MKRFLYDKALYNMTVPTVRPSQHQARLRRVLVSRVVPKTTEKQLTLRGVFMKKPTIFAGAGLAGALAIAIFAFTAVTPSTNVSALQLAQDSSSALANMTPQEAEYKKFYPYFTDWLQKAQKASDLRMLSYDQVVEAYPEEMGVRPSTTAEPLRVIDNPSDGKTPDVHKLRYLEFTAKYTDGFESVHKIVIGINENNIPEAAFTQFVSGQTEHWIGG